MFRYPRLSIEKPVLFERGSTLLEINNGDGEPRGLMLVSWYLVHSLC